LVTRVLIERGTAFGAKCLLDGRSHRFHASQEVILSLGAIDTPKVLMQPGIGDAATLESHGIHPDCSTPFGCRRQHRSKLRPLGSATAFNKDSILERQSWESSIQSVPPFGTGQDGVPVSPP
jgi:GMC oxidoreductase